MMGGALRWTAFTAVFVLVALSSPRPAAGIDDAGPLVGPTVDSPALASAGRAAVPTAIDLGTLGGTNSWASAINDNGEVVGSSQYGYGNPSHAFLWTQSEGMIDLGTLGGEWSDAVGINDREEVTGNSNGHAFYWSRATGMIDVGTLGPFGSRATAINNNGQILGQSSTSNGRGHAFIWSLATGIVDLGTLGGNTDVVATAINTTGQVVGSTSTAAAFSWTAAQGMIPLHFNLMTLQARTVNDSGEVAGVIYYPTSYPHPFIWRSGAGVNDLTTLQGPPSGEAFAVNAVGQVAGITFPPEADNRYVSAFLWTPGKGYATFGELDGMSPHLALNDHGQVASSRMVSNPGDQRAFVWSIETGMVELPALDGTRSTAAAISNAGDVAGQAQATSGYHAVLWRVRDPQSVGIEGSVSDGYGGIRGVTVAVSGGGGYRSISTGSGGQYAIVGLSVGSTVTITPSKDGFSFVPPSRTVTLTGIFVGLDFTGVSSKSIVPGDHPAPGCEVPAGYSKHNLVVIIHGIRTTISDPDGMARNVGNAISPHLPADWDILLCDWDQQAAVSGLTPSDCLPPATDIGLELGRSIVFAARYQRVHFIAHSCGAHIADNAARVIRYSPQDIFTVETLLDAFVPGDINAVGQDADWVEHYIDTDGTRFGLPNVDVAHWTDQFLPHAYNVDVTVRRPVGIDPHSWPWRWYVASAASEPNQLGWQASVEAGTAVPPGCFTTSCVRGATVYLGYDNRLHAQRPIIQSTVHFTRTVTVDLIETAVGDVVAVGSCVLHDCLHLFTHSPSWAVFAVPIDQPANTLTFTYSFDGAGPGWLQVFVDGEQVMITDQSLEAAGAHTVSLFLPEELQAGTHNVTFRIDPSGATQAAVTISDISLQFYSATFTVTYPPASPGRTVFRPSSGYWFTHPTGNGTWWGVPGDIPVPGDYDGNGGTDIAVFRPSNGYWYFNGLPGGTWWGVAGDQPLQGDFDGDGKADIAVYRPSNGYWYVIRSSDSVVTSTWWGVSGDIPVPGDFDGDGKTDLAVLRPSNGYWYILRSSDSGVTATWWAAPGDVPVPGDYDGDGKTDLAVYRPSNGYWYVLRSSDSGVTSTWWGVSGDIPEPGDYDSDGKADVAVYRPSNGFWYVIQSSDVSVHSDWWGLAGDIPLALPYIVRSAYYP